MSSSSQTDILTNSPDNREGDDPEWEDGGVASSDGIIEPTRKPKKKEQQGAL